MTLKCSHIPCLFISGHMAVIYRYILFPKSICPHVTVICFRSLARDMAVYDRHMTVYDGKGASFPSHSCWCDQYKTCYTGHFGFCTRYMRRSGAPGRAAPSRAQRPGRSSPACRPARLRTGLRGVAAMGLQALRRWPCWAAAAAARQRGGAPGLAAP